MNDTNNVTTHFSFTFGDASQVGVQLVVFILSLSTILLLLLFRKEKSLKHRGISPYIAIIGIWILMIRIYFWMSSAFKIQNPSSVTRK
jgi:hypothetical protein